MMRRFALLVAAFLGPAGTAGANGDLDLQACYAANDRNDYPAAIELCTRAAQSGNLSKKDAALAFNDLGNAYNRSGDHDRAIDSYGEAIKRDPDFEDAYFDRGTAYDFTYQYELAVKDYTRAIELRSDDATAYFYRGNARTLSGDYANAVRDYEAAAKVALDYVDVANWSKGQALFNLGKFSEAAATFRRYLAVKPDYSYGALWLYLAEARAGKDGKPALAKRAPLLDPTQWPAPVVKYYLGKATRDDVLTAAKSGESAYLDLQACEAIFYVSEFDLISGDTDDARIDLADASGKCPKSTIERGTAQTELGRM